MKPFTPRPYQTLMTRYMLDNPRCAIWAGMGLGKTAATLAALDALLLTHDRPALVLAPLRVAVSTWPDEVRKWPAFSHLRVQPIAGTPAERIKALRTEADIFTANYEILPWLVDCFGARWPFGIVVADESTRLKSFRTRQGGKRARALGQIAWSKVERFIELTGTPSPNGLADLWGQMWFLDQGERLGKSFSAFTQRWFYSQPINHGAFQIMKPRPNAQTEIQDKVADLCFSLDPKDWFDLDEPIVREVPVDLPPAVQATYLELEREMYAEFGEHQLEAVSAAARTIKCLQLANGAVYTDEACSEWVEAHDGKIEALRSIVEEAAGAPVLVAYHFRSDLARLLKAFPRARELDKDPQTIRDWNAGKIRMLLAHPASAGHGLNLQDGGNILAVFGHWWDLEQYMQIVERIGPVRQKQAGHDRPVFIYHIVARGTVDELVCERRQSKRSVQDILLERMKHEQMGNS